MARPLIVAAGFLLAGLFGLGALGPTAVLARGQQVASPAFSPDGKALAYLAPSSPGAGFQLWTVPTTQSTAPTPKQITSELGLDALSAPVWI